MGRGRYAHEERRVLNPHGRRHYRRIYSLIEVRAGLLILLLMGCFLAWVGWMGAHPDPGLFANGADLLDPGKGPVERGPLPEGLAAVGFVEGPIARFDADNLFKKINGRAPFFKSRGFVGLTFVSLAAQEDGTVAVDVELYDMGSTENALGTYAAEKAQGVKSQRGRSGQWHRERNALFMTAGTYYARAIGTDESEAVGVQLEHLRARLDEALAGQAGELPWAHRILAERMGGDPGEIAYFKENAMSFGFGRQVYALDLADGETQVFLAARATPEAAAALAAQFVAGFASYGEALEMGDGPWVKDRYLSSLSTARARGSLVAGVRGAPDRAAAEAALAKILAALSDLPQDVLAQARASVSGVPEGDADQGDQAVQPVQPVQATQQGSYDE